MSDKLETRNGETVSIDLVLAALDKAPDKAEVMEALRDLRRDKVKEALDETVKAARFDLSKVFDEFLSNGNKADRTKQTYTDECRRFFQWLDHRAIHVLQVTVPDVDCFKAYLLEPLTENTTRYSQNTARLTQAACSAFYKYLVKMRYIEQSPFMGLKYPPKQYRKAMKTDQEKSIPVMNDAEYQAIIAVLAQKTESSNRIERESAQRMVAACHFMGTYGLRVGDLLTVRIEDSERFSYRQKGGDVLQKDFASNTMNLLQSCGMATREPFAGIAKITVQKALQRIVTELVARDALRHPYSCHDFRHYFAVNLYRETGDIYAVKEALGHANVTVTEVYLASLGLSGKSGA